jgi:hypothetical protein
MDRKSFITLGPGVNAENFSFFGYSSLTPWQNKLECLSTKRFKGSLKLAPNVGWRTWKGLHLVRLRVYSQIIN